MEQLPTTDELYNSTIAEGAPPEEAGAPTPEGVPPAPPAMTPDEQAKLPTTDELYSKIHEEAMYPTVGRIVSNFAAGARESYAKIATEAGHPGESLPRFMYDSAKESAISGMEDIGGALRAVTLAASSPFLTQEQLQDAEALHPNAPTLKDSLVAQAKAEGRALTPDELTQIAAEGAMQPLLPFVKARYALLAPLQPLFDGAMKAAKEEGVPQGAIAAMNAALVAVSIAHMPGKTGTDALATGAAHMPEDAFIGAREPTPAEAKTAEIADKQLPPAAEPPTLNEMARQIAPDTFQRYDGLKAQSDALRSMIEQERESNVAAARKAYESGPAADDIAAVKVKADEAAGRGAQSVYSDILKNKLAEKDAAAEQAHGTETENMAAMRQQMQAIDYQMRDLSPDISKAFRDATEKMSRSETVEHEAPVAAAPPEALTTEKYVDDYIAGQGHDDPHYEKFARENSDAIGKEFEKRFGEAKGDKEAEAQVATAQEGHTTGLADNEKIAETLPNGISQHFTEQALRADRPAQEAHDVGKLVEEHYKTRSQLFEGKEGSAEKMYLRDMAVLKPKRAKELAQGTKTTGPNAKIRLATESAHAIIRLMKTANASSLIHEIGHHWFDELMRDAENPNAPERIVKDAKTLRDWAKFPDKEPKTKAEKAAWTRAHERVARGFERYLMEGVAPSRALAGIFARFKGWLMQVYKTVDALHSPINDDVRNVFDNLLATKPEKTVIDRDSEAGKMLADIHEADARLASPEMAAATRDNIERELDKNLMLHDPEVYDAVKEAESGKTPSVAKAPADVAADSSAKSEPINGQRGEVTDGGGEPGGKGAGDAAANTVSHTSTQPPESAIGKFEPNNRLIDRAGNIRLDNLNTPEDVSQVLRDVAQENDDFTQSRRGVLSDGEVLSMAEALGMDPAFVSRRKLGEAFNAEQIMAARKLLIQSATNVRDAAVKADGGTKTDILAYGEARSRHRMIQEQVAGITAEAGRALRAFRELSGSNEAKQIGEVLNAAGKEMKTDDLLFQLEREAKLIRTLESAQRVSKFVNDSKKAALRDMVLEYYINALISGPITHLRYSAGNALNALWTPLVEIPTAALFGALRGDDNRVYLGESGAQLHGLLKGSKDGFYAAATAWKTGIVPSLPGERFNPMYTEKVNAIPGIAGKAINIPGRSVASIHSFFKFLRYEQNIQGLSYRTAMQEGLKNDGFVNRVAELSNTPPEPMMETATAHSLKELYMTPTDYHSAMGALTRFTNQSLPAKIIVPFMKIGSQITRNAFIERTPLGFTSGKVRGVIGEGGAEMDHQLAKMATGVALMGVGALLTLEGHATGDGPTEPDKRRLWLLTHTPNSIRVGNVTVPYQGLGHLGMLLRFSANMTETAHGWDDADGDKLAKSFMSLLEGFNKSVMDDNFMRGAKDMLDAVYHPQEYGANYLKSFATNWLPFSVGSGQIAREIDPYKREQRSILDAAWAKVPFASENLYPRRDMFGKKIPSSGTVQSYDRDPVIRRMQALNMGIGRLERKIGGVQLSDRQFDDYQRQAGGLTNTMLHNLIQPGFETLPQGMQIKQINDTIGHARDIARGMIKFNPANQNIMQQMIENKRSALR